MSPTTLRHYQKYRAQGCGAANALFMARTIDQFFKRDDVRLRLEPECESYFDVYGQPEGYVDGYGRRVSADEERQSIADMIDRDGCYTVVAEYQHGGQWHHADSVGMCVYADALDPHQNYYVPDLMRAALEQS